MYKLRVCIWWAAALLALVTALACWAWSVGGLTLTGWLGPEPAGRAHLTRRAAAVAFDADDPLPLNPRGGGFHLRLEGWLLPPADGPLELAVVSLGSGELAVGGARRAYEGLAGAPWPAGWRLTARPQGEPAAAVDRDPRTRWASGRVKRGDEELRVDFAGPERVLGVVLDSAAGGPRECPAAWRVERWDRGQGWVAEHEALVPFTRAGAVDAFFGGLDTTRLKVRQSGASDQFWWGVNELYVITDSLLDRRALTLTTDGPLPLRLTYRPPDEEQGPEAVTRDYGLLRLYWRPAGGRWAPLPPGALCGRPLGPRTAALYRLGLALGPLAPWLWALALGVGAALWARRAEAGAQQAPPRAPAWFWAVAVAALAWLLADAGGLDGLGHFARTFLYGARRDPPADAWLLAAGLAGLGALAAGIHGLARPRPLGRLAVGAAATAAVAAAWLWVRALGLDAPLTAHDHGVFLYSHWLWDRLGPAGTHYVPAWNAGMLEWEAVRNGSAASWLLARPLTAMLPVARAYNLFPPLIFALMAPLAVFAALRSAGLAPGWAALGGLMALMPHTNWAFWLTMGATSGLLAATACLGAMLAAVRLLESPRPGPWPALALAGCLALALFWLPSLTALALPGPMVLIIYGRRLRGRRLGMLALGVGLAAAATAAWLLPFWRHYALAGFAARALAWHGPEWSLAWARWLSLVQDTNPLIWLPGLAGLAALEPRRRLVMVAYLLNLLLFIGLVSQEMPDLQLHRLELFWAVALIWPAAAGLEAWWRAARSRGARALAAGVVAPLAAASLVAAWLFFAQAVPGRQLRPLDGGLEALTGWLGREASPPGRVLLAGRSDSNWHGYAAWMALYCRRGLIADFYAGVLASGRGVALPEALCRTIPAPADFARLLVLYDVGQVVADRLGPEGRWPEYLAGLGYLEPVLVLDQRFAVYAFAGARGRVLEGRGMVRSLPDGLLVIPGDEARLVLSQAWLPGLAAEGGVRLEPVELWPGTPFVAASGHGGRPFEIRLP